jgi:hypothetical protein
MRWSPRALKAHYNENSAIDQHLSEFDIDTIKENRTCLNVMRRKGLPLDPVYAL